MPPRHHGKSQVVTAQHVTHWLAEATRNAGLSEAQLQAAAPGLARYVTLLGAWGRKMNLVGVLEPERLTRELVADSLHLAALLLSRETPPAVRSLDLGAGAGLPGLPLRLFWKAGFYELVEVRLKRVSFMRYAVAELAALGQGESGGLGPVSVTHGKAEDALAAARAVGGADLVVGRAFMPWPAYLALAAQGLGPGGRAVVMATGAPPAPDDPRLPPGFTLEDVGSLAAYETAAGSRWFWCFLYKG